MELVWDSQSLTLGPYLCTLGSSPSPLCLPCHLPAAIPSDLPSAVPSEGLALPRGCLLGPGLWALTWCGAEALVRLARRRSSRQAAWIRTFSAIVPSDCPAVKSRTALVSGPSYSRFYGAC